MKSTLKKAIEHLIFSNLLVSISIGMLCIGINNQLNFENKYWYGLFVFSSTLFTYNFQRYIRSKENIEHPTNHLIWIKRHIKFVYIIFLVSLILIIISFLKVYNWEINSFLILLFSSILSAFYINSIKSLREIPHLKIHLIALIWVTACGFFPLINEKIYTTDSWIFVGAFYFYVLAVTIPFDIRDLKYDNPKLRTFPQVFGIKKSKVISLVFLFCFFLILTKVKLVNNALFICSIFLTLILILTSNKNRNEFHYSGLIEGSIFLLGVSLFL